MSASGLPRGLLAFLLAASLAGCARDRDGQPPASPKPTESANEPLTITVEPFFRDMSDELGIDFVHVVGRRVTYFFPEIMVGGGALLDFDQDGDLDVYLVNGNYQHDGLPGPGPLPAVNRLYRQEADGRFTDVTAQSGLDDDAYGMGVAVGDINNDGFPDVYVTNYGPDRLFLNEGDGTFRDITREAGIENARWSVSACFEDLDRDGWLDLFVTNYIDYFPSRDCFARDGRRDYCSPSAFDATADAFYRNTTGEKGVVSFENAAAKSGIASRRGSGLGVVVADVNQDLWPDIFVANDGKANFLWMNQGDGTFQDEAVFRGVAYDAQGRAQANMGVAVEDINGDDLPDFFVTHLDGEPNALYVQDETLGFHDRSMEHGLALASFPLTAFGAAFADLDHDGDLDLATVTGRMVRPKTAPRFANVTDNEGMADFWKPFAEPNQLFLNKGDGNFTSAWSPDDDFLTTLSVSRALCIGDVDNDGDVDFLVVNAGGRAQLFFNIAEKKGNWLRVRAVEPGHGGRDSHGAVVSVLAGDRVWKRTVRPGSGYCSSHDPRVHFGLGPVARIDKIHVLWPNGQREEFPGCETNAAITLRHGEGQPP